LFKLNAQNIVRQNPENPELPTWTSLFKLNAQNIVRQNPENPELPTWTSAGY
jgi:hypothetical protein